MTEGVRHIANHKDWVFGCPEGTWTGRLDQKAWGRARNLMLYFSDEATGQKFWFSVFSHNRYRPRDNSHDFQNDAEPGDLFTLTTRKTKTGSPDLATARKLSRAAPSPA